MITATMITVIARYTAAAGAADAVRQLLVRHAAAARAEPGCLRIDAHQGIDNPDEFALVQRCESQSAFAEHRWHRISGATSRPNWSRCSPREAGGGRANAVTTRTTCSPVAVEIDLGELT